MATPPLWLKALICCELTFQLPFFFYAVWALLSKSESIRFPGLIYGAHTATTMVPVLSHFIFAEDIKVEEKAVLIGFYAPVSEAR